MQLSHPHLFPWQGQHVVDCVLAEEGVGVPAVPVVVVDVAAGHHEVVARDAHAADGLRHVRVEAEEELALLCQALHLVPAG